MCTWTYTLIHRRKHTSPKQCRLIVFFLCHGPYKTQLVEKITKKSFSSNLRRREKLRRFIEKFEYVLYSYMHDHLCVFTYLWFKTYSRILGNPKKRRKIKLMWRLIEVKSQGRKVNWFLSCYLKSCQKAFIVLCVRR